VWIARTYRQYAERRRTLSDLAAERDIHPRTIQRIFDRHAGATGEVRIIEEQIVAILDAFYFSRGDGVLVCRTAEHVLHWRTIATERVQDYADCIDAVSAMGRTMVVAVIDGRKGVRQMFLQKGIVVQVCQFHQLLTVKQYIPARAKTEAARALRAIAMRISDSTSIQFETALDVWHILYGDFLKERTYGTTNKRKWQYTHKRLRSAYRSLRTNLPWLFTFECHPQLSIPKTTNHCDGLFAHIIEKIGIHRGLSKARRKKMLDYLLEQYSL
jgi:hypothetical protein